MKLLMLGRWLPPPRRPVRATREYHVARRLARSHPLTLAFVTDNLDASGPISTLRAEFGDLEFATVPRGWKSLLSALRLASGESCTLSYARSNALQRRLGDRLKTTAYDLVCVTSSSMIPYALEIDPAIPMVVDFGEVESEWWLGQAARGVFPGTRFFRTEATRLRLAEAAAAQRAVRCFAATERAAETVRGFGPKGPVTVISDGIDLEFFAAAGRVGKTPTVIVNASMTDEAEVEDVREFCRGPLRIIRAGMPGVRFMVTGGVGAGANIPGVEIMAPVSDVRPFLHSHAVAAAPLRLAGGVRRGVLEPMAASVPVVTTTKACEQLKAQAGRDLHVADDPESFARQVVRLLKEAALRRELGENGRRFVESTFSWEVLCSRLVEGIEESLRPGPPPSTKQSSDAIAAGLKS
jgi:glycosyltransferase involved in cell wall biosynthesis